MKKNLENELFVRRVLNLSNEPLLIIDGDTIKTCNETTLRFLGIPRDKLVGKKIWDILDFKGQDKSENTTFLSSLIKSKGYVHTARIRTNSGREMPYEIEYSVVSMPAIDGFIMNLNSGIRSYQQRKPNHETAIYDSLVPSFGLSKRGIIQDANTAAVLLLGYGKENLLKRHFDSLIRQSPQNANSITSQLIREVLHGKKVQDIEIELVNSDDESVWVSLAAVAFGPERTSMIEILAVDITARKAAEVSRNIAQEQVALWTEVMTHDLNNVNQSILFSIGYVLETVKLPEEAKMKIREAIWEIRRGSRMISNLRKLNQLRNHPSKREAVDLVSCMRNVVSQIQDQIIYKEVEISLEGSLEGLNVYANENLDDVFFNVIENSIIHDPHATSDVRIKIKKQNQRGRVRVEIEDQGPGISDNLKPIIFNRTGFLEGHEGGRGLGLTLVHEIVQSIGGDIWIEDRVEGKSSLGTRVIFELDLWDEDKALECDLDSCISFYMSNHCLFCEPSLDNLKRALVHFGISPSAIEVINVDDPSAKLSRTDISVLPLTRICDKEITGLADPAMIHEAVVALMLKQCASLTWLRNPHE